MGGVLAPLRPGIFGAAASQTHSVRDAAHSFGGACVAAAAARAQRGSWNTLAEGTRAASEGSCILCRTASRNNWCFGEWSSYAADTVGLPPCTLATGCSHREDARVQCPVRLLVPHAYHRSLPFSQVHLCQELQWHQGSAAATRPRAAFWSSLQ